MNERQVFFVAPCAAGRQSTVVDPLSETRASHESIHPAAFTREKEVSRAERSQMFSGAK